MVPVASTTSLMSPCSTLAEKCWTGVGLVYPSNSATVARTARAAMAIHQLRFVFLLIAEGVDGVKPRCLSSGIEAEEDSDGYGEDDGDSDGFGRHLDRPFEGLADYIGAEDTEEDSGGASDEAECGGFGEKLQLDGGLRGSDGFAQDRKSTRLNSSH